MEKYDNSVYLSVLEYWFLGDHKLLYKSKWFPNVADGMQQQTDLEIFTLFNNLLNDLIQHKLDNWLKLNIKSNLAYIILSDQFSRHIYRYQNYNKEHELRRLADELATFGAENLIQNYPYWKTQLSSTEIIFALMPYRHKPTITKLEYALDVVQMKETIECDNLELLNKFRKQTLTRLQHLQDRAKAEETDDILERVEFKADDTNMVHEPLTESTLNFLLDKQRHIKNIVILRCNKSNIDTCSDTLSVEENIDTVCNKILEKNVVISLSGGVDSMVIIRILIHLRTNFPQLIDHIIAVHIDYANRAESGKEAEFVENYCHNHHIIFEKRIINEVTRGITDRDKYEKVAREIRYTFYDEVLQKYHCHGVIFGHHIGDIQENVVSNIMRGCSPLHLSGMSSVGVVNGVNVWRPLLLHTKEEIFSFAHTYGVPYFKDTTPTWSTRGKLRRQLIPLLIDMYGNGCLRNLSNLAKANDDFRDMIHDNVFSPFLQSVEYFPCGLCVNVINFRDRPLSFWKEMMKELMHSLGMSLVREKAVSSFIDRLHPLPSYITAQIKKRNNTNINSNVDTQIDNKTIIIMSGWIELRKNFYSFLTPSGDLLIFLDGVLVSDVDQTNRQKNNLCLNNIHHYNNDHQEKPLSKRQQKKLLYQKNSQINTKPSSQNHYNALKKNQHILTQNINNNDNNNTNTTNNNTRHNSSYVNIKDRQELLNEFEEGLSLENMLNLQNTENNNNYNQQEINIVAPVTTTNNTSIIENNTTTASITTTIDELEKNNGNQEIIVDKCFESNTIINEYCQTNIDLTKCKTIHFNNKWIENFRFPLTSYLQLPIQSLSQLKSQLKNISTVTIGCWSISIAVKFSDLPSTVSMTANAIAIDNLYTAEIVNPLPLIESLSPCHVLSGTFAYSFTIPINSCDEDDDHMNRYQYELAILNQYKNDKINNSYSNCETELLPVFALKELDSRLRFALPLIVPIKIISNITTTAQNTEITANTNKNATEYVSSHSFNSDIIVSYTYIGPKTLSKQTE